MKTSVIIPAYNSEKTISKCISSLLRQTNKPDEIIVVDDGSIDKTKKEVKKFKDVKLISQINRGPASARNLGVKKAKGDILLFTDDDCIPDRYWVSEMEKPFRSKTVDGVQGRYMTKQEGLIPRFVQMEIEDRYDRMKKRENIDFIGSYSAGYRKSIFMKYGGFDESFPVASGEDPELSFKLSEHGHKMVFNEKAVVYHNHTESFSAYMKKKFWRAYWRVQLYKKHPGKMKSESYTPQTLKFQILMMCLAGLSVLSYPFYPVISPTLAAASIVILVLLTLPLAFKNAKKSVGVGLFTPVAGILRSVVFALGLLYGTLRLL